MMRPLQTARLDLEPLQASHADEAWPQLNDERMWTYFMNLRPQTIEELRELYRKWEIGSPDPGERWLNWLCRARSTHELTGSMQATVLPQERAAYIAYAVYRTHQRQGYAREACEAVIAYLRETYNVEQIFAEMDVRNAPSYRLAESLGFKRIETRAAEHGELTSDEYVYELVEPAR